MGGAPQVPVVFTTTEVVHGPGEFPQEIGLVCPHEGDFSRYEVGSYVIVVVTDARQELSGVVYDVVPETLTVMILV